ncbi:MAG: N-acetylglucosamine-6-phosphate deacetylase [Sphingomonadales bacterium]
MTENALTGARVLLPQGLASDLCIVIKNGLIQAITPEPPNSVASIDVLGGGIILPGFIDVQVNGGGGALFNDAPNIESLRTILDAHRRFGTTGMMITLISDDLDKVAAAIDAVGQAIEADLPGLCGLHIEGPFIAPEKRGIHDAKKVQKLSQEAMRILLSGGDAPRMVTLAPEEVSAENIKQLTDHHILVCAGHTNASFDAMAHAFSQGVTGVTHLFNAMSPLHARQPGAIAAALESSAWCGIIVDGKHVHPAMLRMALRAKTDRRFMLVTDAMPAVGTDVDHFMLAGQRIDIKDGTCLAADGTLAGANLTMIDAVRNATSMLGITLDEAVAMASANPAEFLGMSGQRGTIATGMRADLIHVSDDLEVAATWIGGDKASAI